MKKDPKSSYQNPIQSPTKFLYKVGKWAVILELTAVLGSYIIWRRTNRDQNFRLTLHRNCPPVLDAYYRMGELMDKSYNMREYDKTAWMENGKWY